MTVASKSKGTLFLGLLAAWLLLFALPAAAADADSVHATFSTEGVSAPGVLSDANSSTYTEIAPGGSITVTRADSLQGLYLVFDRLPSPWTLTDNLSENRVTCGKNTFLHEYVDAADLFGGESRSLTLTFPEGAVLADLYAFSDGDLPDWVQRWEPPCEEADLLLISSHADDEQLFFAGILPLYAGERGYEVQVAYIVQHYDLYGYYDHLRSHEQLNGLWAVGITHYPVMTDFPDLYSESRDGAITAFANVGITQDDFTAAITSFIRRFRPLVVVSHDLRGEYGHGTHILCAEGLTEALKHCGNPDSYPEMAAPTWMPEKVYLHLYEQNPIVLNLDEPLAAFGGKTAFEMTQHGFSFHKSQHWTWFYGWIYGNDAAPITRAAQIGTYSPCHYGLYHTTVGTDTVGGDIFENVTPYSVRNLPQTEPETEAEPVPVETQPLQTEAPDTTPHTEADPAETKNGSGTGEKSSGILLPAILVIVIITIAAVAGIYVTSIREMKHTGLWFNGRRKDMPKYDMAPPHRMAPAARPQPTQHSKQTPSRSHPVSDKPAVRHPVPTPAPTKPLSRFLRIYLPFTALLLVLVIVSVVYVRSLLVTYENAQPERRVEEAIASLVQEAKNGTLWQKHTLPDVTDGKWESNRNVKGDFSRMLMSEEAVYSQKAGLHEEGTMVYQLKYDGSPLAEITLTAVGDPISKLAVFTWQEWEVTDVTLMTDPVTYSLTLPDGFAASVNGLPLTEADGVRDEAGNIRYTLADLILPPELLLTDRDGNRGEYAIKGSILHPVIYDYTLTLPDTLSVSLNGSSFPGESMDGGYRLYKIQLLKKPDVQISDLYGNTVAYEGGNRLPLTALTVRTTDRHSVTVNGSPVPEAAVTREANPEYEAFADYAAGLPMRMTCRIAVLEEQADIRVTDPAGMLIAWDPEALTLDATRLPALETVPADIAAEVNVLAVAEKWSLFTSKDLTGASYGFYDIAQYLIPSSYQYKIATAYAGGIDITFTSLHTLKNPPFTGETVTNFVRLSDNAFSVDIAFDKHMVLLEGRDVIDSMNDRFYFVKYDDPNNPSDVPAWKLASMKEIVGNAE